MTIYCFRSPSGLFKQTVEITDSEVIFNQKHRILRSEIKAAYFEDITPLRPSGGIFLSVTGEPSSGMYREKTTFSFKESMRNDVERFFLN